MKGLVIASFVALLSAAVPLACVHPYSGKPARLKMPRKKKPPKGGKGKKAGKTTAAAPADETCRTNFFAEPYKRRRRVRDARNLARRTSSLLIEADGTQGDKRRSLIIDAMHKLDNALEKDPYGPEPTFQFAVAYAIAGRKACALAFLERLKLLGGYEDTEREASRVIQRALREPAFESFRKEADTALGE